MLTNPNVGHYPVNIRVTNISDFDDICKNERLSNTIPWSDKMLRECLAGSKYTCFLMIQKTTIIGHMIIQQILDEIHLHNVCVLPKFRGEGLGHYWLDYLHQFAQRQQVRNIFLEVRVSNQVAKSLYANRGYREIGVRKNYYSTISGREDALVMKTLINPSPVISNKPEY